MFSEAGIKETDKAHWKQKLNRMKKNHGLSRKVAQNLEYRHIHTLAGIYLGKRLTFKVDEDRINRVAKKVIQGLHYLDRFFCSDYFWRQPKAVPHVRKTM